MFHIDAASSGEAGRSRQCLEDIAGMIAISPLFCGRELVGLVLPQVRSSVSLQRRG